MGTKIAITSDSFNKASDKSWLATRKGLQDMRGITLDISAFPAALVTNGYIPSGTPLGKITATGKYGPYDQATPATDGTEVLAGHLFEEVKVVDRTTDPDCGAALFWTGVVKESRLPVFTGSIGEIDAPGKADVAGWIRYE